MNTPLTELSAIADLLYDKNSKYGEIFEASRRLRNLLQAACNKDFMDDIDDGTIYTNSGKAIGIKWASMCVDDIMRTKKFCNGIFMAIEKLKAKNKGKVHILYAGTGPFATLIIPLISRYSPKEVSFTLLEINPESFEGLTNTIQYFNAQDYVTEMTLCDAIDYEIPKDLQVDILVSETMMHGLKSEQQVAICCKLLSQIENDVIMIPEEVNLNLLAINRAKRNIFKQQMNGDLQYFKRLGNLFTFNKEIIKKHQEAFLSAFPNYKFPEISLPIPFDTNLGFDELSIETHIKVFEDEYLEIDESSLTVLLKLMPLNAMLQTVKILHTNYVCGEHPGLQCRLET
jgi:hypothetical protein